MAPSLGVQARAPQHSTSMAREEYPSPPCTVPLPGSDVSTSARELGPADNIMHLGCGARQQDNAVGVAGQHLHLQLRHPVCRHLHGAQRSRNASGPSCMPYGAVILQVARGADMTREPARCPRATHAALSCNWLNCKFSVSMSPACAAPCQRPRTACAASPFG
jgi:hypothetical protein